jgi:phosphoribosylanthranilate isomerase
MRVRVKICGVMTPADAVFAAECGADALGLNFYAKSPRFLTDKAARAMLRELTPFVASVGVFVSTPPGEVSATAARLGLRAVQTYADAPLPFAADEPAAYLPAFRVKDAGDLDAIRAFVKTCHCAAVLIDSFVVGEMGGTGHRAPWDLLAGFDPGVPVILAGGLTPDNVAEAIRAVRPWGVDVASGVESSPGVKDAGKVRAFVQNAQAAGLEGG